MSRIGCAFLDGLEAELGAVAQGAAVVCGGNKPPGPGSFFEPTVVRDVAIDSELWQLETFGPVAGIASFSEDAEAVRLANDGPRHWLLVVRAHLRADCLTECRRADGAQR